MLRGPSQEERRPRAAGDDGAALGATVSPGLICAPEGKEPRGGRGCGLCAYRGGSGGAGLEALAPHRGLRRYQARVRNHVVCGTLNAARRPPLLCQCSQLLCQKQKPNCGEV